MITTMQVVVGNVALEIRKTIITKLHPYKITSLQIKQTNKNTTTTLYNTISNRDENMEQYRKEEL